MSEVKPKPTLEGQATEHVPGPWTWGRLVDKDTGEPLQGEAINKYVLETVAKGSPDFFFVVICQKPDGEADVCHTGNGPTSAAHARLIAAAPDLLAALKEEHIKAGFCSEPENCATARAIAKATA